MPHWVDGAFDMALSGQELPIAASVFPVVPVARWKRRHTDVSLVLGLHRCPPEG